MQLLVDVCRLVFFCDVLHILSDNARFVSDSAVCGRQNTLIRFRHSMDCRENLRNDSSPHNLRSTNWWIVYSMARQLWIRQWSLFTLRQQNDGKIHVVAGSRWKSVFSFVLLPCLVLLHSSESQWHQNPERKRKQIESGRQVHQTRSRKILSV